MLWGDATAAIVTVNSSSEIVGCSFRRAVETINTGTNLNNGCSAHGVLGDDDEIRFSVNNLLLSNNSVVFTKPVKINVDSSARISIALTSMPAPLFQVDNASIVIQGFEINDQVVVSPDGGRDLIGLIDVLPNSQVTLKDCLFSRNQLGVLNHTNENASRLLSVSGANAVMTIDNCKLQENQIGSFKSHEFIGTENSAKLEIIDTEIFSASSELVVNGITAFGRVKNINAVDSELLIRNSTISNSNFIATPDLNISASIRTRIENTRFSSDSSLFTQGAIMIDDRSGGGEIDITDTTISSYSIGISSMSSILNLQRTVVSQQKGTGIRVNGGETNVLNSTIRNAREAGIEVSGQNPQSLLIVNSTFSGNGVGIKVAAPMTSVIVANSTIVRNVPFFSSQVSGANISGDAVTFINNIVAGNNGSQITLVGNTVNNDFNLIGDDSDIIENQVSAGFVPGLNSVVASSNGNVPASVSQIVRPISNSGNNIPIHLLPANSPAINVAAELSCQLFTGGSDQIGNPRNDGECDIGAMEFFEEDEACYVVKTKEAKVVAFCL